MKDLEVFAMAGNLTGARLIKSGVYTHQSSVGSTWNIVPQDQGSSPILYPLTFICLNYGTSNVTISAISGMQFIVNNVAQSNYTLRPGKSAYIFTDGGKYLSAFGENEVSEQAFTPTSGQTISISQSYTSFISTILDHATTIAALTIALPANPFAGQTVTLVTEQAITALTVNPAGTFGAPPSLTAGGFARFTYSALKSKWYRNG